MPEAVIRFPEGRFEGQVGGNWRLLNFKIIFLCFIFHFEVVYVIILDVLACTNNSRC